jgi:hypothetical protein
VTPLLEMTYVGSNLLLECDPPLMVNIQRLN